MKFGLPPYLENSGDAQRWNVLISSSSHFVTAQGADVSVLGALRHIGDPLAPDRTVLTLKQVSEDS